MLLTALWEKFKHSFCCSVASPLIKIFSFCITNGSVCSHQILALNGNWTKLKKLGYISIFVDVLSYNKQTTYAAWELLRSLSAFPFILISSSFGWVWSVQTATKECQREKRMSKGKFRNTLSEGTKFDVMPRDLWEPQRLTGFHTLDLPPSVGQACGYRLGGSRRWQWDVVEEGGSVLCAAESGTLWPEAYRSHQGSRCTNTSSQDISTSASYIASVRVDLGPGLVHIQPSHPLLICSPLSIFYYIYIFDLALIWM